MKKEFKPNDEVYYLSPERVTFLYTCSVPFQLLKEKIIRVDEEDGRKYYLTKDSYVDAKFLFHTKQEAREYLKEYFARAVDEVLKD